MAVYSFYSAVVKDGRNNTVAHSELAATAGGGFRSGYFYTITNTQLFLKAHHIDIPLTTGVKVWWGQEFQWITGTAGAGRPFMSAASRSAITGIGVSSVSVTVNATTGAAQINFVDANGLAASTFTGYTFDTSRHWVVLEVSRTGTNTVDCKLYVDDMTTPVISGTHTNAGGAGTITYKSSGGGQTGPISKGDSHTWWTGDFVIHDNTGSGPGSTIPLVTYRIQATSASLGSTGIETGSHPTGIPEEADWRNTADSGAAAVTEVDDAWGSSDGTRESDTNQSTSTTSAKTQSYSFPTSSLVESSILGVQFSATVVKSGTGATATGVLFYVMDDGTENEVDTNLGEADYPPGTSSGSPSNAGAWVPLYFTAMPGGGGFTEANIDAANFKVRKKATANAVNIVVWSVDRFIYYVPGVTYTQDVEGALGASTWAGTLDTTFISGAGGAVGGGVLRRIFKRVFG